jgi:hypothetical protein
MTLRTNLKKKKKLVVKERSKRLVMRMRMTNLHLPQTGQFPAPWKSTRHKKVLGLVIIC